MIVDCGYPAKHTRIPVLARLEIPDGVLDSNGRASSFVHLRYSRIKIKKSRITQHLVSVGGTKDVVRMTRADKNF